ncbi:MAG: long-chain fatty acid--CoA ligase, partial [Paracoccaceae bacterium]
MAFDTPPQGFTSTVALVADHARARPAGVAMRQKRYGVWNEITWAALQDIMQATAAGLMQMGVGPGDHIG